MSRAESNITSKVVKQTSNKVPRGYIPAWSTRTVALSFNFVLLMQITYYATDVVGLSAGMIGTLLLASKIFDGITDLVVGFIIDRTNTKLGKARPYEIFIVPLWIFTVMLFSTPNLGTTGKAAYIFTLYSLINAVCATFLNGSEAVYMARSLKGDVQRAKVLSISGLITIIFSAAVSIVLPILMHSWGVQPGGWTRIALVIGVPAATIGLGRMLFIKEIDVEENVANKSNEKISVKDAIKALSSNKYVFILGGAVLLANAVTSMTSAVGTYYFRYIVGDLSKLSIIGMVGLVVPFVLLLFPVAMRTIGAMNFVRIGLIAAVIGDVLVFFAGANVALVVAGQILAGIGSSTITMMIGIFLMQCMDFGEWNTGKRVEGILNSVTSFSSKLGGGLASGGVGVIMALTGYVGKAEVQSAAAKTAIVWSYSLVPAVLCVAMLIILHFYDLDKKMSTIQEEIKARKVNK
jgi:sugar (glycoside-pentoside-hexuronide) transporter